MESAQSVPTPQGPVQAWPATGRGVQMSVPLPDEGGAQKRSSTQETRGDAYRSQGCPCVACMIVLASVHRLVVGWQKVPTGQRPMLGQLLPAAGGLLQVEHPLSVLKHSPL